MHALQDAGSGTAADKRGRVFLVRACGPLGGRGHREHLRDFLLAAALHATNPCHGYWHYAFQSLPFRLCHSHGRLFYHPHLPPWVPCCATRHSSTTALLVPPCPHCVHPTAVCYLVQGRRLKLTPPAAGTKFWRSTIWSTPTPGARMHSSSRAQQQHLGWSAHCVQ